MSDFVDFFGKNYFDHVFMTVRNPYDRILSEFKMRATLDRQGFWQASPNFSHWLEISLAEARRNPFAYDNHMRPQWEFIGTDVEPMKFEHTIPAIVRHMALRIGIEAPTIPPHKHSTAGFPDTVVMDRVDRLRIQDFYYKYFELFGYDMDDSEPAAVEVGDAE